MANENDLLISERDAGAIVMALGSAAGRRAADAEMNDALTDLLTEAERVPHERLPADFASMNSRVTYEEHPGGARRTIHLVHPSEADAAAGRVSVLSPVGRTVLGRREGALVSTIVPGGRDLTIRLVKVERLS